MILNTDAIFYNAPIGMAIVSLEGKVIKANSALCETMGYTEYELQHFSFNYVTHPADLDKDVQLFKQLLACEINQYQIEKRYYHKNGDIIYTLLNVSSIKDKAQRPLYFILQIQDITAIKRVTEILQYIEDSSLLLISEHAPDGTFLYVSNSSKELLGYTPEELVGKSPYLFYHPDDIELIKSFNLESPETKEEKTYRYRRMKKDGSFVWLEAMRIPIFDEEGNLIKDICFTQDITQRKEAEQLAIRAEKLAIAGELAAGIAHEIRNPLTSLKGFLQLIESGENKKFYIDIMKKELNRIEEILSQLLVLSKPQSIVYKKLDILELLQDVCILLDTQAILKNIQIIPAFTSRQSFFVYCNENQLKQVFFNFIKNAIESMPNGGKIFIQLEANNEFVSIIIRDQGIGISEDIIKKLGQPFYSTKEKGTGLGLLVSYKIIEEHKGRVSVSSEINKGSTFVIELPISL